MSMFSKKKKTYTSTSTTRLINDEDIKSSQKTAVLEHILHSTTQVDSNLESMSLVDRMRDGHAQSIVAKMDKFYRWAKSGNYYYGVPEPSVMYQTHDDLGIALKDVLEKELTTLVNIDYAILDLPNPFHFAWVELTRLYDYSSVTNKLATLTAWEQSDCYLVDMEMHYCPNTVEAIIDDDYYKQYGISAQAGATPNRTADPDAKHTAYVVDSTATIDFARVTYGFTQDDTWTVKTLDIPLDQYIFSNIPETTEVMGDESTGSTAGEVNEPDYVMGSYTFSYAGNEVRQYFTYVFGSGTYPTLDTVYASSETTGQYYPRIYARLEHDNLATSVLKDTEAYKSSVKAGNKLGLDWVEFVKKLHEDIEDTESVYQLYISLSLPAYSKDPLIHEYMYKYFYRMYQASTADRVLSASSSDSINREFIVYQAKQGASISISDESHTQQINYSGIGMRDHVGKVTDVGEYSMKQGTTSISLGLSRQYHAYFYQVTENTYREVRVYNLQSQEKVSGGHWTSASGTSSDLLMPVDRVLLKEFKVSTRELLYSKALYIVFNTLKVVKQKWYQTGVFKVVMFVVAVIFAIPSGGSSLTIYAVAMAVAQVVLIGVALSALAKLAVKIGINTKIVAVVAVIALAYGGYLNLTNAQGLFNASAKTILTASNSALSFTSNVAKEELAVIAKEMAQFESSSKAKDEALKEYQDQMFSSPMEVDPAWFYESPPSNYHYLNLYQTPEEYYTRTVHTGNPGIVCFDLLSDFVEQSLTLPTINQTLASLQGRK